MDHDTTIPAPLPVIETVRDALKFVWGNKLRMMRALFIPAVIIFCLEAVPYISSMISETSDNTQDVFNRYDFVLLHIRTAGKRSNLVASRVDGHSMAPMLHPGDIVVIDRDDKIIVRNKMFAIYHEGGLTAKFLEKKTHLLILRPVNPNAEIQIIDLNENPQPIVGKIIGAWKDL